MKVDFAKLDRAFNPQCVVVVGDKREGDFRWLRALSDFKGKLYSVQIAPEEIEGINHTLSVFIGNAHLLAYASAGA